MDEKLCIVLFCAAATPLLGWESGTLCLVLYAQRQPRPTPALVGVERLTFNLLHGTPKRKTNHLSHEPLVHQDRQLFLSVPLLPHDVLLHLHPSCDLRGRGPKQFRVFPTYLPSKARALLGLESNLSAGQR